ncbi:MAG: IS1634 family transposase [Gemmatimonadaceae bacterium]|nr:IS1634 family transposase [Gemmatimonadaceae bacterium]
MASFQIVTARGHRYIRIVESFRDPVTKRPKLRVLRHLGRADDILQRLDQQEAIHVASRAHGAVAAVWTLARELGLPALIDAQLPSHTGRARHDGLTVGESLTLAAVGRACQATSKRGFAAWAAQTTLGDLAGVDVTRLTSQHFWDQMHHVPIAALAAVETALVERVLTRFALPVDTVLYDATNFFTFLATTNARAALPARGHNKQKRHDLRQVGVALCCTRGGGGVPAIPLFHQVYGGARPDVRVFAEVVPLLRERFVAVGGALADVTVVYDKGNVSKHTQALVDGADAGAPLHYVAALTAASQRALVAEATPHLQPVVLSPDDTVQGYRTRRVVWGAERTLVVLVSPRLQQGQRRGVEQHLAKAVRWLEQLQTTLAAGRQRRTRATLEAVIAERLRGQHLREILTARVSGEGNALALEFAVDTAALDRLEREWFGRLVLMTDQHDWSTADIIRAYRGQAVAEGVFRTLKDPLRLALRPQYHWTDQKLHVHAFLCVVAYLLATLVHLRAVRDGGYVGSVDALFDQLTAIRRVQVARPTTRGRPRVTQQLETLTPLQTQLVTALALPT